MFVQKKQKKPLLALSHTTLLTIGFVLTAAGTVGTSVVQGGLLHLEQYTSSDQLVALVSSGSPQFAAVTWAVVLFALGTMALPLYAMLLVEGFRQTTGFKRYFLRMLAFAALAEVPFDLAYSGKWLDITGQNPLLGYCVCLLMLYLLNKLDAAYADSKAASLQLGLLRAAIVLGAAVWVILSQALLGVYFVALCAVFWFFGMEGNYTGIYTMIAAVIASLLRFPAPFGLVAVHWYDAGKGRGKQPWWLFYLLYVVLLALCAVLRFVLG